MGFKAVCVLGFIVCSCLAVQASDPSTSKSVAKKADKEKRRKKAPLPKDPWLQQQKLLDHPEMKKILSRQGQRRDPIRTAKSKGVVGESDSGLLKIRSLKGLKSSVSEKMKKLVEAENKDRKKSYEILKRPHGEDAESLKLFRENIYKSNKRWDPPGSYFFEDNKWQQSQKEN